MTDTKSPLGSLTINAALIGLIVDMLRLLFGVEIAPELAREIGASISSIVTSVAFIVAIYGRYRARHRIEPQAA